MTAWGAQPGPPRCPGCGEPIDGYRYRFVRAEVAAGDGLPPGAKLPPATALDLLDGRWRCGACIGPARRAAQGAGR